MNLRLGRREKYIGAGLLVLLALAVFLLLRSELVTLDLKKNDGPKAKIGQSATATTEVRPIDRARPLAVMIDNHPEALPQSGLALAAGVWEAPVEGAFTRLMAVFRSGDAPEIGPVRSARPYFLDWAAGLDAVYAHVGGSDEALADLAVRKEGLDDANEFSNGAYFWRDAQRVAPHSVYTSTAKLRALIVKKGWRAETDRPDLSERGLAKPDGAAATSIAVRHSGGGYLTTWTWDAQAQAYLRNVSGDDILTRDGKTVSVPTVVVIETNKTRIADPYGKGLIGIETLGTGPAAVYRNGTKVTGEWSKKTVQSALELKDANGQPIPLSDGLVWYEVVLTNAGGTAN